MKIQIAAVIVLSMLVFACTEGPSSPRGFSLPEGNVDRGEVLFKHFQCLSCHTLDGVEQPYIEQKLEKPIVLGGKVGRVKTYAELVTAIINPSHRIAAG